MAQNPLQQYFRQPKIFISLPSKGIYSKEGTISGDPSNLPVYGMTGMDEIIVKTPDALVSGESTVAVVRSCCPSIKDPWNLSVLDTDLMFAAIRIATYGNKLDMTSACPKCNTINEFDLDLTMITDHYSKCHYDNKIVWDNLVLKTQPITYKQQTEFNIKNFELQKKLSHAESMENAEEQQIVINNLWQELAQIQQELFMATVEAIETPEVTVTERGYIAEWLANCDSTAIDAIKQHLEKNKKAWSMPAFPVKCEHCDHGYDLIVDLDQSNFFA